MKQYKVSVQTLYDKLIDQMSKVKPCGLSVTMINTLDELVTRLLDGEGFGEENEVKTIKSK